MALLWTTPRQWETNDPITEEKLNEISDDLTYLYSPSVGLVTIRGTGTNQTYTSLTPVDLDPANYTLNVELNGSRAVNIELLGAVGNSSLAALTKLDVFIDNTTYLSSLTGTFLVSGVWVATQYVAANIIPVQFKIKLPANILSAGFHTFVPRIWVTAGTATWYEASVFSQFKVGED